VTGVTDNPNDPDIGRNDSVDRKGQDKMYLVLSEEERAKGFVEPVRYAYKHEACGAVTTMGQALAETYACKPEFYSGTFCVFCNAHFPVGANGQFVWDHTDQKVGTRRSEEFTR
jgi:hypothetical protein